jgi:sulfate permease, SulP family
MNFRPRLLDTLPGYHWATFSKDLGAGVTVGIVALPLAMAIAIASGLPPSSGLWAAIVGGFVVALLGGSNVQIAGPANAFIVVVFGIVLAHGVTGLLLATMMAGVMMILMGALRLGRWMRHVPDALIEGFTSAIAVIILVTQIKDALGLPVEKMPADVWGLLRVQAQELPHLSWQALAVSTGVVALLAVWQRMGARAAWAARIPGSMLALILFTGLAFGLKLPVETIGSRFGAAFEQFQHWPTLSFPSVPWEKLPQLVVPALTLAVLSAIESLLCARIADDLQRDTPAHAPNQELVAQGVANMAAPLLGGLPITGTIARTVTNLKSGGRTPISGVAHSFTLLAIMLIAAPLAVHIPLAVLAGILIFIAWNMGDWKTLFSLHRLQRQKSIVLGVTFILTLWLSLTWGIAGGLIASYSLQRLGWADGAEPL